MKGRGGYDGASSMHQLGEQVDAVYAKVQEKVDKYGRSPLKELEPEPLLRPLSEKEPARAGPSGTPRPQNQSCKVVTYGYQVLDKYTTE
jgi:hypothetical protein